MSSTDVVTVGEARMFWVKETIKAGMPEHPVERTAWALVRAASEMDLRLHPAWAVQGAR